MRLSILVSDLLSMKSSRLAATISSQHSICLKGDHVKREEHTNSNAYLLQQSPHCQSRIQLSESTLRLEWEQSNQRTVASKVPCSTVYSSPACTVH
jgi:hypothetical protein